MFKGYIPTNGKKPSEPIKGRTSFYPLEEVEHLQSYGGVLQDNVILIDLDDRNEADILYQIIQDINIKCNIIKTDRGKHFYFINDEVKSNKIANQCPLSFTIDYKCGDKNTVVPLKINGTERKWLQEVDELDSLPKIYILL